MNSQQAYFTKQFTHQESIMEFLESFCCFVSHSSPIQLIYINNHLTPENYFLMLLKFLSTKININFDIIRLGYKIIRFRIINFLSLSLSCYVKHSRLFSRCILFHFSLDRLKHVGFKSIFCIIKITFLKRGRAEGETSCTYLFSHPLNPAILKLHFQENNFITKRLLSTSSSSHETSEV